jgi:hypothetical protein
VTCLIHTPFLYIQKCRDHKDSVNESQKPGVYRIPCECGLVYIGETGRNLSVRLKEHKTNCEKAEQDKSAVAKHTWTYDQATIKMGRSNHFGD